MRCAMADTLFRAEAAEVKAMVQKAFPGRQTQIIVIFSAEGSDELASLICHLSNNGALDLLESTIAAIKADMQSGLS